MGERIWNRQFLTTMGAALAKAVEWPPLRCPRCRSPQVFPKPLTDHQVEAVYQCGVYAECDHTFSATGQCGRNLEARIAPYKDLLPPEGHPERVLLGLLLANQAEAYVKEKGDG